MIVVKHYEPELKKRLVSDEKAYTTVYFEGKFYTRTTFDDESYEWALKKNENTYFYVPDEIDEILEGQFLYAWTRHIRELKLKRIDP